MWNSKSHQETPALRLVLETAGTVGALLHLTTGPPSFDFGETVTITMGKGAVNWAFLCPELAELKPRPFITT